jgi:hypothetical protein
MLLYLSVIIEVLYLKMSLILFHQIIKAFLVVKGEKVKLSLCLTKHHAMKTYWGSGGIAPFILDLGTRWR